MKLTNLLDFANNIYHLDENVNSVRRNKDVPTKSSTAIKMFLTGMFCGCTSTNSMIDFVFDSKKLNKKLFKKGVSVPKQHGFDDCIIDTNFDDVKNIHKYILSIAQKNKVFKNHTYRGKRVAIIDGVESFETTKNIEGLHLRKHKDGTIGHYYKSLGVSYLGDNSNILLDMVPFKENEIEDDKDHNTRIKAEGEITVLKRSVSLLKEFEIEIAVMDAMFENTPCLNALKDEGIDCIVRIEDKRRKIYKEAEERFSKIEPTKEYEIVEISTTTKKKYSKEAKKKNTNKIKREIIVRDVTDAPIGETVVVSDEVKEHPKYVKNTIVKEKVIKKVKAWADIFIMDGYNYNEGKVKVVKTIEITKSGKKIKESEMYALTTIIDEKMDIEFIVDLMHKRWNIELKNFRNLKTNFNLDHLFIGELNAIKIITYLIMILFNLIELYTRIHTKQYLNIDSIRKMLLDFRTEVQSDPRKIKLLLST